MKLHEKTLLKEIVAGNPSCARVFEELGIDFCCEGNKPLGQACIDAGVPFGEVIKTLEAPRQHEVLVQWDETSLDELMKHIVEKHHAFCRDELKGLSALAEEVLRTQGANHSEVIKIQKLLAKISSELLLHLVKEEETLFPMIRRMEEASARSAALPRLPFGTIAHPIGMMVFEHDETGVDLLQIRKLANGFTAPADANAKFQEFYKRLQSFEKDMHEHVFLENYVLFPRTAAMEKSTSKGSAAP
jgi:regulator of cell morphogenesis and NO signaling